MQKYSRSQGKFIEVPDQESFSQGVSTPIPSSSDRILPQVQSTSQAIPGGSTDTITGHTLQEHQAALQQAMRVGDKNAVKNITTQYDQEFQYQKDLRSQLGKQKKGTTLSSDSQKRHDALQIAFASLDGAEQNLITAGGAQGAGGISAVIPGLGQYLNPHGAAYHNTKIELATQMAKAITGGVRPGETVVEQYLHSLPDVTDRKVYAQSKLQKLRNELLAQARSFKYDDLVQANSNGQDNPETQEARGGAITQAVNSNLIFKLLLGGSSKNNFLGIPMGGSGNILQDVVSSVQNMATQPQLQKNEALAKQYESQAIRTNDMQQRKLLFQQANQVRQRISQQAGDIGKSFSPDVEENPLLRSLAGVTQLGGDIELAKNAPGIIKGGGNFIGNLLKGSPAKITQADLLKGLNLAEDNKVLRSTLIDNAQTAGKKIAGSTIVNAIEEWAPRAKAANPTEASSVDNFISGVKQIFQGKKLDAQTAKNLWDDADKGFTASGIKGSALESSYHRTIRDVLRQELDKIAPGFEKTTQNIKKGLDLEELLQPVRTGVQRKELREGLEETPSVLNRILNPSFATKIASGGAIGGIIGNLLFGRKRE